MDIDHGQPSQLILAITKLSENRAKPLRDDTHFVLPISMRIAEADLCTYLARTERSFLFLPDQNRFSTQLILRTTNEAWSKDNFATLTICPTEQCATEVQSTTGIASISVEKFLADLKHARPVTQTFIGKRSYVIGHDNNLRGRFDDIVLPSSANLVVYDAQQFSSQQLTALCDAVSHVGGRLILCGNWTAMDREHPDVAGAISDALGHGLPEVSVGNHLDKAWELGNELEPYTKTEKELLRHAESLPWVVVANCWWEQGANSVRSIHASKEEALNAIPEIFSEESNEHSFFFQGDWSETDSPSVSAAEWQLATLPEIGDRVRISNDAVVSLISLEERLPLPEYLRPDSRETDPLAKTRSFLVFHANSEEARTFPDDYTLVAKVEAQSMDHAVFLSQHTDAQWTANPGVTSFMTRPRSTQSGDVIIDHDVARRYVGGKEWRPALTASDRVVHELAPESFTADPEPELRELHTNDFRLKF